MSNTITVRNFEFPAEPGYVFQEAANGPWLTVISSGSWWCDEPLSFGKLDGADGYIYDWTCRSATASEIATAAAAQKAADEKARKEREGRITKARTEQERYQSQVDALTQTRDELIRGLVSIKSVPKIVDAVHEKAGSITPPGKGFSWTWFLNVVRDSGGAILWVSWSNEEAGASYWGTEEVKRSGESVQRIAQYWREGVYHYEDYPGPGVLRDELTPEELAEVERLEALKFDACIKKQIHHWTCFIHSDLSNGKAERVGNEVVITVPDLRAAEQEKAKFERLMSDRCGGWSRKYVDPIHGQYSEMGPLPVRLESCTPAASYYEQPLGGDKYELNVRFPKPPTKQIVAFLKSAGFQPDRYGKGRLAALKTEETEAAVLKAIADYNR